MLTFRTLIQPENFPVEFNIAPDTSINDLIEKVSNILDTDKEKLRIIFDEEANVIWSFDDVNQKQCVKNLNLNAANVHCAKVFLDEKQISAKLLRKCKYNELEQSHTKIVYPDIQLSTKEGGFKDESNGNLYFNCSVQTQNLDLQKPKKTRFSRDTQTTVEFSRSSQTNNHNLTQTEVDRRNCREIIAKVYFSAAQLLQIQVRAVESIQLFWRSLKSWRLIRQVHDRRERDQVLLEEKKKHETLEKEIYEKKQKRIRECPQTIADLKVLRNDLDNWVKEQSMVLNSAESEGQKKMKMNQILKEELDCLLKLNLLKNEFMLRDSKLLKYKIVQAMAQNYKILRKNGDFVSVETDSIRRAQKVNDCFLDLSSRSRRRRKENEYDFNKRWLDQVVRAKWLVKTSSVSNTNRGVQEELLSLLEREIELISRQRKNNRPGLKKRVENLFFKLSLDPLFNPEASPVSGL